MNEIHNLYDREYREGEMLFLKLIGHDRQYPILCDADGYVYCHEEAKDLMDNFERLKIGDCLVFELQNTTKFTPDSDGTYISYYPDLVPYTVLFKPNPVLIDNKEVTEQQKKLIELALIGIE